MAEQEETEQTSQESARGKEQIKRSDQRARLEEQRAWLLSKLEGCSHKVASQNMYLTSLSREELLKHIEEYWYFRFVPPTVEQWTYEQLMDLFTRWQNEMNGQPFLLMDLAKVQLWLTQIEEEGGEANGR